MSGRLPKPAVAFAAVSPDGTINQYWVRAMARDARGTDWHLLRKNGWRVVKVRVIAMPPKRRGGCG